MEHRASAACPGLVGRGRLSNWPRPATLGSVRDVVILGSTGSIGTQSLEVVADHTDQFRVVGLAAEGSQIPLLAQQALDTGAHVVAVSRPTTVQDLQLALYAEASRRLGAGRGAATAHRRWARSSSRVGGHAVRCRAQRDHGLDRVVSDAGCSRSWTDPRSRQQGVAGGRRLAGHPGREAGSDCCCRLEHSALAQCLRGGAASEVDQLILTASGGVRGLSREQMRDVTPNQALAHPTWNMGRVITTNSATLVNKGLELLEAHLLYGVDLDRIDVVVHPQSIVHSMVQFVDEVDARTVLAADMKLPIALGLSWPDRLPGVVPPCDWSTAASWTFEPLTRLFRRLRWPGMLGDWAGRLLPYTTLRDEVCVDAFHDGRIGFTQILDIVGVVLREHTGSNPDVGSMLVPSDQLALSWCWTRMPGRVPRQRTSFPGDGAHALNGPSDLHRWCRCLLRIGHGFNRLA